LPINKRGLVNESPAKEELTRKRAPQPALT
jgi:hypothetical protein